MKLRLLFFMLGCSACGTNYNAKKFYNKQNDAFSVIDKTYRELTGINAFDVYFINSGFDDVQVYWDNKDYINYDNALSNDALRKDLQKHNIDTTKFFLLMRSMKDIRCKFVHLCTFDSGETATEFGFNNGFLSLKYKTYYVFANGSMKKNFYDHKAILVNDSVIFNIAKGPYD